MVQIVSETSNTSDSLFVDEDLVDGRDEVDNVEEQEEVSPKVMKDKTAKASRPLNESDLVNKPSVTPKQTQPASKLAKQPVSQPTLRKSVQDYKHEESIEGLRDKYINTSQGIDGFDDSIYLPNGEEVTGVWRLVDAFSVTPSHDHYTFIKLKAFPHLLKVGLLIQEITTMNLTHSNR